jgi:hypothetical protein
LPIALAAGVFTPNVSHKSIPLELVVIPSHFPGQERRRTAGISAGPPPAMAKDPIARNDFFLGVDL